MPFLRRGGVYPGLSGFIRFIPARKYEMRPSREMPEFCSGL